MIISQTSRYALKALIFLYQKGGNGPVKVKEVSENLNIPRNYLSKIFHVLTRNGVLKSHTGKTGGFQLAVPPDRLLLSRVIEPFESSEFPVTCILGQSVCSDENPCSAHGKWKAISALVGSFFDMTTLQELLEREKKHDGRDAVTTLSGKQ
ncbi:MAG TPA: Rrf2 family transcriptional regulator [Thermodesulfobacteriota bacterium]|nr:Rrf2 family transcriptional regulator [Thermodesulfobacteriota bacterium]